MTDDPWRPREPGFGQQPPPPYGGYNPYQPPNQPPYPGAYPPPYQGEYPPQYQGQLAQRGGIKGLVLFLCVVGLLVVGGCTVGVVFVVKSVGKNAGAANAFLRDVRAQRFAAAYARLCPDQQAAVTPVAFSQALEAAVVQGRGVTSFDITSSFSSTSSNGPSTRSAGGTVTFANGQLRYVTFDLAKQGGGLCIESGYQLLN